MAAVPGSRGRASRTAPGKQPGLVLYVVGGALISAVFVLPLLWEALRSLQPESVVTTAPSPKTFGHLTFANYHILLSGQDDIIRNVANSLIVAIGAALLTALVATLAGYGFALFRF